MTRSICFFMAAALSLAACDAAPARGPSETRGLPVLQPVPPSGGAGGVVPIERPPGSRGGGKGS